MYLVANCFSIGQKPEEGYSCSMQMTTTADGKMLFLYSAVSDSRDQFHNSLCMVTYLCLSLDASCPARYRHQNRDHLVPIFFVGILFKR